MSLGLPHLVHFADFFLPLILVCSNDLQVGGLAGRRTSIPRAIRHGQLSRVGDSKQPPGGRQVAHNRWPMEVAHGRPIFILFTLEPRNMAFPLGETYGFLETSGNTHLS